MAKAYNPKKRNTGVRDRNRIILISTEGKNKTETLYFSDFSSKDTRIKFAKGNQTDPVSIAKNLVKDYRRNGLDKALNDQAFCVIDGDLSKEREKQIQKADSIVKDIDGKVIISNPCIEIWFLCHYTESTKQFFSANEVIEELKKYIPNYEKNMYGLNAILDTKKNTAISNAKKLEKHNKETGKKPHKYDYQPSSEVYKIIEVLFQE